VLRVAGAALLIAGCLEFGDPLIPERETPALLLAHVRVFDTRSLQVDGTLSPGREATGFLRVVQVPQIHVAELVIDPREVDERGVRVYHTVITVPHDRTGETFDVIAPDVRGAGPLPPVRMHGLRRTGADTLRLPAGADIVLRVDTVPAPSLPAQRLRQWFIEVRSPGTSFRISSDGPPPPVLRIPAEFVAASTGGRADISLIYFQTADVRDAAATYRGNILLDVRLNWIAFFEAPAP
jgi:hypothetical protein